MIQKKLQTEYVQRIIRADRQKGVAELLLIVRHVITGVMTTGNAVWMIQNQSHRQRRQLVSQPVRQHLLVGAPVLKRVALIH